MLLSHGLPKLLEYADKAPHFPDPLGVGSASSLALTIFAELVCAALLVVGLGTRVAAAPLLITMLVAALVIHAGDPFGRRELALVYAVSALVLALTGGGRFSLDAWIASRRQRASSDA